MKCLLCDKTERGNHADVPYICGACVQALAGISAEALAERYIKALGAGQTGRAYALYTFVPRRVRREHPLPRNARRCL
ncbi:MAG: hypothetical protein JRJ09_18815 [Deltaproteobacteria bacterium]|nr:hypothetical protein [Deltaproteobacteria bacterium]